MNFNLGYDYDYALANALGLNPGKPSIFNPHPHWNDIGKLPSHQTFSNESAYYRPWMKAGYWANQGVQDQYIPSWFWEMPEAEKARVRGLWRNLGQNP